MTKLRLMATAGATLLWAGAVLATPTAQQQCDYARITAWKVYASCVEGVVAKDATLVFFDEFAAFAKCRHAYAGRWTLFQNPNRKPSLLGSTCIGTRFTNNGDQTVTDNLSGLIWEKKSNLDGTTNFADPHDGDNAYTWSTGAPYRENGTAFTSFLETVNSGAGFAGANGWRFPTLAELQTIVLDFACRGACSCPSLPCVDPALDGANTQSYYYWSANGLVSPIFGRWGVAFGTGNVTDGYATGNSYARAVRGGL